MLNWLRVECVRSGPRFFRYPLSVTPFAVKKAVLQQILHWQFRHALAEGELDFMQGRWAGITINDLALSWVMTVKERRLLLTEGEEADVWFRGNACDLLLIAAGKQDPDTLFFQRRLAIEGDTELGLEVKNLMDAVEPESLPVPLRMSLLKLAAFVEAGLNEDANSAVNRAGTLC